MLFNSYAFIFGLLPVALLGDRWLRDKGHLRIVWLLFCSLLFYAWWNPPHLPLLLASVFGNYVVGDQLRRGRRKWLLVAGIAANLVLLGYFKYAVFVTTSINELAGSGFALGTIALPLAISFFTFQQIAYLADCYSGDCHAYTLTEYALFVSFFPQLIAGPIVHHAEMMPQFGKPRPRLASGLAIGSTIFTIGLFKKTVIADGIAPFANALFNDPQAWESPTLIHAWIGTLAYGIQIYFDFSGYSDMAIGAARMFGIWLPMNFFAPYRAATISDFWRRWHMTLSRFLRDYLYIPLGGNRFGTRIRYRNLMITMLLGGLWHGAGWTFVLWGLMHGLYLVAQHGWSRATRRWEVHKSKVIYRAAACAVTLAAVHLAWVYFRAESLRCANHIAQGMIGFNGVSIPGGISSRLGFDLSGVGIGVDTASGSAFVSSVLWIIASFIIIWTLPTTQQFVGHFEPALAYTQDVQHDYEQSGVGWHLPFRWRPSFAYSLIIAVLATAGLLSLPEVSEFLYFQF